MALDPIRNFAISRVATTPSPAISGTTLVVDSGDGALFPDPSSSGEYNLVIYPNGEQPDSSNAEIVRATARTTDTFTITREQESTSAREILEGDVVMLGVTRKVIEDIQDTAQEALTVAETGNVTTATTTDLTGYLYGDGSNVGSMGINDGWMPVSESWSYASATTITVPSGAASRFQVGDKVKCTNNSTTKYFYIRAVASTTLTVTGGSDYTVHDSAITSIYVSRAESPLGFPRYFNFTPTITASGGTAPSFSSTTAYFTMRQNEVFVSVNLTNSSGGTAGSGAVLLLVAMPTSISAVSSLCGTGVCYSAGVILAGVWARGTGSTIYMHDAGMNNVFASHFSNANRQIVVNVTYYIG